MTQRTKVDELREALQKQKGAPASTNAEQLKPQSGSEGAAQRETISSGHGQTLRSDDHQAPVIDELRAQLNDAEERAAAHHDKLLRMMAEFDNYRKRMERDHATAIAFANEQLLKDIMVVLDHLDEALSHVPRGEACPLVMRAFAEGVELTFRQFLQVLKKYGFEEIPADTGTNFDPSIHEAISQVDAEGRTSNTVVTRQRRGYALNGRLLRAALVVVAK